MQQQDQVVCSGCRTLLLFPRGASNVVRCALCNMMTSVAPNGVMDMARLICGGCRTLLMHPRGATSVRCSCCQSINLVPGGASATPRPPPPSGAAHVSCRSCFTVLIYPAGAPSVKCAVCQFITNVASVDETRPSLTSTTEPPPPRSQSQTVVVQNPMTLDESGKLVSNVVVGVKT